MPETLRAPKLAEAIAAHQRALDADPARPLQAYLKLSSLLDTAGDKARLLALWRRGVEHHAGNAAAHFHLGRALRALGKTQDAIAELRRALELDPGSLPALRFLADLYAQEGADLPRALELCKRIQKLLPDDADAVANEANVLELLGKVDEAYALMRPLVQAGHRSPHLVQSFGRICQHLQSPTEEALPLLRDELVRPGLSAEARRAILRILAGLSDALGRADEAFLWLQQAKHLDSALFEDSKEELLAVIERSRACFTRERMASLPRATHGSERPIFIVGMPRSGTSLAEQILASHPAVFGAGELTTIIGLARTALGTGKGYPECFTDWTPKRIDSAAGFYLRQLHELSPDALRVTDKMPFNFLHLGMIEVLFPGARVIHCSRRALDTCLSCYFMEFTPKLSIFSDLTTLGRYYRGYRQLMRHWKPVLSLPVFELSYEHLLEAPEVTVRELLAFCGLEWNDACMRFHESKRRVKTFSYHQVRKPLYTSSVGRAAAYARHLGPLIEAIGDELDEPALAA